MLSIKNRSRSGKQIVIGGVYYYEMSIHTNIINGILLLTQQYYHTGLVNLF